MLVDSPFNRVFITGITGFTGKYLGEFLKNRGFSIYGVTNQPFVPTSHAHIWQLDLLDIANLENILKEIQPHYVIHLAALAHSQLSEPIEYYRNNVIATENLVKAIVSSVSGLKKFIAPSSALIYGHHTDGVYKETDELRPVGHYAWSKLIMEKLLSSYFEKVPILITRPFNYTGPGQYETFVIPKIVKHFVVKQETIELGNLWPRREFNDVHFICDAYYKLMLSSYSGEIVNLCTGVTWSIQDIIDILSAITKHQITIRINGQYTRPGEPEVIAGDKSKLEKMIGPLSSVDIKDTLESMIYWYRMHIN